jgi:hypothetical protein
MVHFANRSVDCLTMQMEQLCFGRLKLLRDQTNSPGTRRRNAYVDVHIEKFQFAWETPRTKEQSPWCSIGTFSLSPILISLWPLPGLILEVWMHGGRACRSQNMALPGWAMSRIWEIGVFVPDLDHFYGQTSAWIHLLESTRSLDM